MRRQKTDVTWVSYELNQVLDAIPLDVKSVLDCGCGKGIIGCLMRIYRNTSRLVGIDIFEPYLSFCREHRFYDELYLRDLTEVPLPFESGEFDVVTCVETIEHLSKHDGIMLLEELERVGKLIIITTPTKFFPQKAFDGNLYQKHRSSWSPNDFKLRGYVVRGIGRSFLIFGREFRYLSFFLAKFGYILPQSSSIILAKKQLR